jgi:hypothetical protein
LQDLSHQFGGFVEELLRPNYYLKVGMAFKEGGHLGDSEILRSREFYLRSDLETSPKGLWQPDLSS